MKITEIMQMKCLIGDFRHERVNYAVYRTGKGTADIK